MSTNLPDIRGVPTNLDPELRKLLLQMREHLRELRGSTGDAAGVAGSGSGTGIGERGPPGVPGPPGLPGGDPYVPDLTPPPTPTGVSVLAGLDFIGILTDAPLFTQGHGYSRTKVYGVTYPGTGPLPTFADAVLVHEFVGTVGSFPSEPSTQWHIWLKWLSVDNVESAAPQGGTNGNVATTGADVTKLLEALTGQITSSQLYADLNTRINLIDGSAPGSVNQRIADEAAARGLDVSGLQTQIDTLVSVSAGDFGPVIALIEAETTARTDADSALASSLTTMIASVSDTSTAAIAAESSVRAGVDGYLGAQYTLRLDVNGRVAGFGISSTSIGGAGARSDFGIVADRFFIAPPAGTVGVGSIIPFTVLTSGTTTPAGEVLPAGVYMDAAYIRNLDAVLARFNQAIITNAMIANLSASKLTVGDGTIGGNLKSSNYIAGSQGWILQPGGGAEFGFANIRGLLLASQVSAGFITAGMIDSRGLTIRDAAGNAILTAGSSVATSTFGGNVTGTLNGTATSTVVNNASTALSNSITANNNASTALSGLNAKLDAAAADVLTGPITMNAAAAILVGTTSNGLYLGNTGLVARVGGVNKFVISATGDATFAGTLSAATGSFAGSLSAATGTFSGSLTAAAVNAVNTVNIAGEAVLIPRAASTLGNINATGVDQNVQAVASITIPATAPTTKVVIIFSFNLLCGANSSVTHSVKRNGTAIYTGATTFGPYWDGIDIEPTPNYTVQQYQILDAPGAGTWTYTVTFRRLGGSGTCTASYRAMLVLGAQR